MRFTLLPILDLMLDFYQQPRGLERFQTYLKTLQGDTQNDLALPIGGFNPMAKEHILDKLRQLKELSAEEIMENALQDLNQKFAQPNPDSHFKVALNVSDDLKGAWTNQFTSDYDSKFGFSGLIKRDFCVPVFWTSEDFTPEKIKQRTLEYALRTIYWLSKPKPKTLAEDLAQEIFVASQIPVQNQEQTADFADFDKFYTENQNSDNYHLIFNFFYGNQAAESLGFPVYGLFKNSTGFDYARYRATKSLKK
jgi:hypothetical protein